MLRPGGPCDYSAGTTVPPIQGLRELQQQNCKQKREAGAAAATPKKHAATRKAGPSPGKMTHETTVASAQHWHDKERRKGQNGPLKEWSHTSCNTATRECKQHQPTGPTASSTCTRAVHPGGWAGNVRDKRPERRAEQCAGKALGNHRKPSG